MVYRSLSPTSHNNYITLFDLFMNTGKHREIEEGISTTNFEEILNDDSIDLVIEVLGGVDPGKGYIESLLSKGKAVITANKDIIADSGPELIKLAQENNTCLYFEAAVAAGIPVLKPVIETCFLRLEPSLPPKYQYHSQYFSNR